MGWIALWLVMAVVVAIVAGSKGRNPFAWGLYGFLVWPIALVHILVTPSGPGAHDPAARRTACPHCAEEILEDALVCKHCGRDVKRTCRRCGRENGAGRTQCLSCATSLV